MEQLRIDGEIFDVTQAQSYIDSPNASFMETFMPNHDTVMVVKLAPAAIKGGKKYATLLIGINGKLIYCRQSTFKIMTLYSKSHFYGYQLSRCLARYYHYTSHPYFCGAYSFVAAGSPNRRCSKTWLCSRWFYKIRVRHGQTWVTFANEDQSQLVTVNFEKSATKVRRELGLLRFAIEEAQRLILEKQVANYPFTDIKRYHALNLPLLRAAEQPPVLPVAQIRFLEEMYIAQLPLEQAVAEGKLEKADMLRYLSVLEQEFGPQRLA